MTHLTSPWRAIHSRLLAALITVFALAFSSTSVAYAYNLWHYTYDGVYIRQCACIGT